MKRSLLVCCGLASLLVAADKPKVDQSKKDLEKLQGTWTLVSIEANGKKVPEEDYKGVKFVFEKNQMTIVFKDENILTETIALDASKKPKQINTTSESGVELQGIYELDGDDLKICMSDYLKRGDRPTEFVTKADRGHGLIVFKRQK